MYFSSRVLTGVAVWSRKKKKKILLSPSPPRHVPSPSEEPGTDLEQLVVGSLVRADKLTLTQRSRIMQMDSPKTTTSSLLVENFQPAFPRVDKHGVPEETEKEKRKLTSAEERKKTRRRSREGFTRRQWLDAELLQRPLAT